MFERQIANEAAQGYRGLTTRLFAPITTAAEAALVVREMALGLLVVAALQFLMAARVNLVFASVTATALALPPIALLFTRSRVAGVFGLAWYMALFAIAFGLRSIKGPMFLLIWVGVFLAIGRACRATFFLHAALPVAESTAASPTIVPSIPEGTREPGNPGA